MCGCGGSEQLTLGEIADEAEVGGEEVVFGQVAELDPAHFVEDVVLNVASEFAHREELQVDGAAVSIVMAHAGYSGANDGLNTQFFVQLAGECLLGAFAGLNFATGKLPFQGHHLVRTALADKNLTLANDERGGYEAQGRTGRVGLGLALGDVHRFSVNPPKRM